MDSKLTPEQAQFAMLIGAFLATIIGCTVARDARRKGASPTEALFWGVSVFLLGYVFIPGYLFYRWRFLNGNGPATQAPKISGACRYCGALLEDNPTYCPSCSRQLRGSESVHGKT